MRLDHTQFVGVRIEALNPPEAYIRETFLEFPVTIAWGSHPIPFRTRKLSPTAPMVLQGKPCGRVGRCRIVFLPRSAPVERGFFCARAAWSGGLALRDRLRVAPSRPFSAPWRLEARLTGSLRRSRRAPYAERAKSMRHGAAQFRGFEGDGAGRLRLPGLDLPSIRDRAPMSAEQRA